MGSTCRVAILGATGSIGTSALDVIARHPGQMRASVLAAGNNVDALLALCRSHHPEHAAISSRFSFDTIELLIKESLHGDEKD